MQQRVVLAQQADFGLIGRRWRQAAQRIGHVAIERDDGIEPGKVGALELPGAASEAQAVRPGDGLGPKVSGLAGVSPADPSRLDVKLLGQAGLLDQLLENAFSHWASAEHASRAAVLKNKITLRIFASINGSKFTIARRGQARNAGELLHASKSTSIGSISGISH